MQGMTYLFYNPGPITHIRGQTAVAVDVAEIHLPARCQHAEHLPQHTGLVGGQVDLRGSGMHKEKNAIAIID